MHSVYDLILDSQKIGRAEVEKQGLYYCIDCRCTLPEDDMYRIRVSGGKTEDLGTCVPMDGAFGLKTRIPVKHLGDEPFQFQIVGKHQKESLFCPIRAEEPFDYIPLLPGAKLAEEKGEIGIDLQVTEVSDRPGSDQNP